MTTVWELLPAMSLFALTTAITPGPNNFLLAASGAQFGVRKTVRHIVGIRIGVTGLILLCAGGVGVALKSHPEWYFTIKYAGISYMLWLTIKLLISDPFSASGRKSSPLGLTQAGLFQLSNIKAWVASLAVVTSYSLPSHYWLSVAVIALVFTITGLFANTLWAWMGRKVSTALNTRFRQRSFKLTLALLMLLSVLPALGTEQIS